MRKLNYYSIALLSAVAIPSHGANFEFAPMDLSLIHSDQNKISLGILDYQFDVNGQYDDIVGAGETGQSFKDTTMIHFASHSTLTDQISLSTQLYNPYALKTNHSQGFYQGSKAKFETQTFVTSVNYQFNDQFSAFASASLNQTEAAIRINSNMASAQAGAPTPDLNAILDKDVAFGWIAGASYHVPEIALRATLAYQSEVTHKNDVTETISGMTFKSTSKLVLPEALTFDFQTGIRETTLLTFSAQKRFWGGNKIETQMAGEVVSFIDDATTFKLGIAEQFTPQIATYVQYIHEEALSDEVNPLAPNNGYQGLLLAASYTLNDMSYGAAFEYAQTDDVVDPFGTEFKDNRISGFTLMIEKLF